ncbi:MAG: polyprenyl diphosphate synthase [Bacillota bacterium]
MALLSFQRLPGHIGVIPDGNRRWAAARGLGKECGYEKGLEPGLTLYRMCLELGIRELTFYGFTHDNTKRPAAQKTAFQKACVDAVKMMAERDASLLVVGNHRSRSFPRELLPFIKRTTFGRGLMRLNFLVNYDWQWDLLQAVHARKARAKSSRADLLSSIGSADVSRIDLIIRWGGRRRLSGFLPVQTIYSDVYVLDAYWPDFKPEQFYEALRWYETQDITLGG